MGKQTGGNSLGEVLARVMRRFRGSRALVVSFMLVALLVSSWLRQPWIGAIASVLAWFLTYPSLMGSLRRRVGGPPAATPRTATNDMVAQAWDKAGAELKYGVAAEQVFFAMHARSTLLNWVAQQGTGVTVQRAAAFQSALDAMLGQIHLLALQTARVQSSGMAGDRSAHLSKWLARLDHSTGILDLMLHQQGAGNFGIDDWGEAMRREASWLAAEVAPAEDDDTFSMS